MAFNGGGQRREKNPNKIGALWLREDKDGKKYFGGKLEVGNQEIDVVVFKNGFKTEDKHPDYVVYISEKRGQAGQTQRRNTDDVPF